MSHFRLFFLGVAIVHLVVATTVSTSAQQTNKRPLRPEDLFRLQTVNATSWSSDGRYVAVEISDSSRSLDRSLPSGEIRLLDVRDRSFRPLSPRLNSYLGFFNATWSPDGHRLAFLSLDAEARVGMWIWTVAERAPVMLRDLDIRIGNVEPAFVWLDNDRLATVVWEAGAERRGPLYFRVFQGRNVADGWKKAFAGQQASVAVVESGGAKREPPETRLLAVDVRTGLRRTLARGGIHRLSTSSDGRMIAYIRELPGQPVAPLIDRGSAEDGYAAVNWGTERHVIDAFSGAELSPSAMPEQPAVPATTAVVSPPPRPDARRLSTSPLGDAALFIANAADGSHVLITGGGGRPLSSSTEIWTGNKWVSEMRGGEPQAISYVAQDGTPQIAWLLLPTGHVTGAKLPLVTIVYPTTVYGTRTPGAFSFYQTDFEHPQLFAALGYAVLLPSMPSAKDPHDSHNLKLLTNGVLPALDAAIATGLVDPDRVAVLGQSDGGFAVQGLITQTSRFRSAIASAGFSDLVSLYGTFYGQYRYGDGGLPEAGQVLRMIQVEKGADGMGGPPWVETERYHANSSVLQADKITTPIMLVHGELDFIPIQQDEELFTMLYRQDKPALLVRYQGEWHTIARRENVLDLWRRLEKWLNETMSARK